MHTTAPRNRWRALLGIAVASFLGCIDFTVVNSAIPAIQAEFGAGIEQLQWVITLFVMALSAFMVIAGRLADLYGRRRAMYAGMALFGGASLGAGLASDIGTLLSWRLVQGIACALLYTASTAIVANAFPERERGRALGLLFSANGIGLAIGPVVGGLLAGSLGWRWVFLLNVPLILVGFALCLGHVEESCAGREGESLDLAGLALLILLLPCALLAITQGGAWGWTSLRTLLAAGAALLLLAALLRVEGHARPPLIRLALFRQPGFVAACAASFALALFYCVAFFLMPLYLGGIRQQGSAAIGWLLLPTTAVMALVSPLAGRTSDRYGPRFVLIAGFVFLAVSAALQSRFSLDSDWSTVLCAFVCMGIGWGCILGPSTVAALAASPAKHQGVAMGVAWTLHNLGGALGLALASTIYQTYARRMLSSLLPALDAASSARIATLALDPAAGARQLAELHLRPEDAARLVEQSFIAGYQAVMAGLLWLSLALMAVLMAARACRRTTGANGREPFES